ncbi:MAG: GAF domain-containing protein [SAR202 cluster bacterium]|nr:GAF domain-containing protein [SAR202 cluster bacterium]
MEFWNIIHPDHQAMFHDMRARRRSGEDIPNPIEYKLLTKQGEVRWADFSVAGPVDFFWGPGFVVSAVDATNRKRAEEIISLRNRQLESLFDIAGILAGVASESEKYSSVMNRLVEMVSGDAGTIRILDESTESLVRLAVSELWLDELPVDHRSHSAIASQAFRTGQPVVVNDYLAVDRANPALVRAGIQSVAAIPIWSSARKLGVVTVCSMSPNFFGREEIAMLTAVVEGLGVLMEKSRLAGQLLRSSQENKIVDELALTMTSNLDMDQVYEQFTTEANKLVKFDRAAINVIDGGRNSLVVKCLVGSAVPGMEAGTVFPLDGTFTQLVAELGDTIVRDYPVWDDPYWETERYFADSGLLSAICIPLFAQGSVNASFTFRSKEPGAFNHNDRTVLERLCTYIGPALANSELYQRTRDAEDALRESNTQLQRTLANLEEAQDQIVQRERMEALGSMSSGIAHDFNNALTPIIGYAELLLNQPNVLDDQETATGYVRRIHTVAARAAELVRSIREFYRPRDGNQVFGAVDLNATVLREIENTEGWAGHGRWHKHTNKSRPRPAHCLRLGRGLGPGHKQPDNKRHRCHAYGRDPHHLHRVLRKNGGVPGDRYRNRNVRGGPAPCRRTVLHHQGRRGQRSWPCHRPRHSGAAPRGIDH